jgi:hypothetical protein
LYLLEQPARAAAIAKTRMIFCISAPCPGEV